MDRDLKDARQIAADNFYRGVGEAVIAGHYDEIGDIVKLCLAAIKHGRQLQESEYEAARWKTLGITNIVNGKCTTCDRTDADCDCLPF